MLTDSPVNIPICTEKAGDWPPLLTLMSNNSSVEQLQSDIAEWFRENQPEGYELAAPPSASKLGCESGSQCGKNLRTPGKSKKQLQVLHCTYCTLHICTVD